VIQSAITQSRSASKPVAAPPPNLGAFTPSKSLGVTAIRDDFLVVIWIAHAPYFPQLLTHQLLSRVFRRNRQFIIRTIGISECPYVFQTGRRDHSWGCGSIIVLWLEQMFESPTLSTVPSLQNAEYRHIEAGQLDITQSVRVGAWIRCGQNAH